VTGVVGARTVTTNSIGPINLSGSPGDSANEVGSGSDTEEAENYQVSADVTSSEIAFANNTTSQGFGASTTTTTSVTVTYANNGSTSVTPSLQSTVLPGGFGFFMGNPAANPAATGFGVNDVNQTPPSTTATFTSFTEYGSNPVATAGFTFEILSGNTPVASWTANVSLDMTYSIYTGYSYSVVETGSPALTGFGLVTPAGSDQSVGYQWDTTTLDVPLGVTLAPGQSSSLTYVATATTSTDAADLACGTTSPCPQILAYSGFGDPIGGHAGTTGGADPYFPVFDLSLPTFDPATGELGGPKIIGVSPSLLLPGVAPATFVPIPPSVLAPVPEPEMWTLMLVGLGLGLAGGVLRGARLGRA
jgi:hypothetical protein